MIKHRVFNVDRFVDKFREGGEFLLRDFIKIWGRGLDIQLSSINVDTFKNFLVKGEGRSKEAFMAELYRVWDLCDEIGHEYLVAACDRQRPKYNPDPTGALPVEGVSLIVRIEREEVFNLAYDMRNFRHAERFNLYQGKKGKQIANLAAATKRLRSKLESEFKGLKESDRVIVRAYPEGNTFNFVIYHEKRVQAQLVFKGGRTRRKVAPFARFSRTTSASARKQERRRSRHAFYARRTSSSADWPNVASKMPNTSPNREGSLTWHTSRTTTSL